MSRRRRRRGPGSAKGANRGGPRRRILITSASPTGQVKGPGTTIQAFVEAMDGSFLSRHGTKDEALEVFLEQFEGPLDLLLYLIRKENISVLDIPMANVLR